MLEQKLNELEQSDIYPFHMPGHKRAFLPFANPYAIDITEIEGFDNLHHATGILQEAQQKAADLYGAKKIVLSGKRKYLRTSCGDQCSSPTGRKNSLWRETVTKRYITRCICGSWFLFISIRKIPPTASRGR